MIHCLDWTPDHEGAPLGSADMYLEEYGIIIRGVRIATAMLAGSNPAPASGQNPVMQLPQSIVIVEGIPTARDILTIPRDGDRLVFFAQCVRAIDQFNARAAEALRAREANAPRVPGSKDVN